MRFLVLLAGCAAGPTSPPSALPPGGPTSPPESSAAGELGTVHAGGPDVWYVIPDAAPSTRFCLASDAAALRVEGARVRFSGQAGEVPANARLACSPYAFSSLSAEP